MKNFALLDENNKVINISIANDDWDSTGWIEYTDNNPASIDGDFVDGFFYCEQPFPSWTRLDGNWISPIPMPTDGKLYEWNEVDKKWEEFTETING
jgi:hypothetical protein